MRLANPIIARLGTTGVVLIDISAYGARIEHYTRFDRGAERYLRIQWGSETGSLRCQIVSCKVHRFAPGDDGLTVYQSGLLFSEDESSRDLVKKLISAHLAGTLVEQVANARGFQPPNVAEMPIFRGGVLATEGLQVQSRNDDRHLLPGNALVHNVGYICFSLVKGRWSRKWTLDPEQPKEGFTVSANEPMHQIDLLVDQYMSANVDQRRFIRTLASLSVEGAGQRLDVARPPENMKGVKGPMLQVRERSSGSAQGTAARRGR
ncbi:MAG: hypothetical protein ACYC7A_09340 [Thermoanaerobaculia bacterium]